MHADAWPSKVIRPTGDEIVTPIRAKKGPCKMVRRSSEGTNPASSRSVFAQPGPRHRPPRVNPARATHRRRRFLGVAAGGTGGRGGFSGPWTANRPAYPFSGVP